MSLGFSFIFLKKHAWITVETGMGLFVVGFFSILSKTNKMVDLILQYVVRKQGTICISLPQIKRLCSWGANLPHLIEVLPRLDLSVSVHSSLLFYPGANGFMFLGWELAAVGS